MDKKIVFGEEKAFYKVYSTVQTSIIYFENPDPEKTFWINFELELDNLLLEGDNCADASFSLRNFATFTVVLKPGETEAKILRQI